MVTTLTAYLAQDRCLALVRGQPLPDPTHGSALFADISGFTSLTERLTHQLGARRSVEELTKRINAVYDAIIAPIEQYNGSVVKRNIMDTSPASDRSWFVRSSAR